MADDTMRSSLLGALLAELTTLLDTLEQPRTLDLATAERLTREGMLAIGARLLEGALAARGTGKVGAWAPCPCGAQAPCEGYRPKQVQTLVGWITLRRAYYHCPACGISQVPLDGQLGLARDRHSPGVRRLLSQFGALLPFAQAAHTLADAGGIVVSASTLRGVSEAVGARREQELSEQVERAWQAGLPPAPAPAPARLYVAMDGVRILETSGAGREAKVGVVVPEHATAGGALRRSATSYVTSFATAAEFGPRLALEAHQRGLEAVAEVVVLGDGAEWIWQLAAEHFPTATQIVDWYHASEHIWELGRALYGADTPATTTWVEAHLTRLWAGQVTDVVADWRALACAGPAREVRNAQVTYFTNQASRMAYDQYRTRGLDIGSGMVESACKYVIGAREKGPGMRWTVDGAQAIANVRVLLFNDEWGDYHLAA